MQTPSGLPGRPRLHVFTTANKRHGGFMSACDLMSRLRRRFHVTAGPLYGWPLNVEIPSENLEKLGKAADQVGGAGVIPELAHGDHALFYMNEYAMIFRNYAERWQQALARCASIQIVFNRDIGGLHHEHWLAGSSTRLYFHDSHMQHAWSSFTGDSPLASLPRQVLAPPVDLTGLFPIAAHRPHPPPVVVGRLAGDTDVPPDAVSFYRRLADALAGAAVNAQFWFMPAPEELRDVFGTDARFRFLENNEMPVRDFLARCHVYLLTYSNVPVPGPRSLMEAMAAGCAPVVIDRQGPRDRVVHGESGLRSNDNDEMIEHTVRLAADTALRTRISAGAVARARTFDPEHWVAAIAAHCDAADQR